LLYVKLYDLVATWFQIGELECQYDSELMVM